MDKFSLQTFIKICLMDTNGRISEIRKKLEPSSGYDFYNSFNRATRSFCNDRDAEKASELISVLTSDTERRHNAVAFAAFKEKFGSSKSLEALKEPNKFTPSGANFEIIMDPLFSVEKAGVKFAYLPWLIQKPDLSQRYAAVALYVMRSAYKGTRLGNYQFIVYDINKKKAYSEAQINANTPLVLQSDAKMLSGLLSEL